MDPTGLLVWLAVIVIVAVVVWFLLTKIALPEPVGTIIQIAIVVIVAIVAISALLNFGGHPHLPH